jgi:aspartyl/asparaginyl beta-hydroxylase (cupin superfamily)
MHDLKNIYRGDEVKFYDIFKSLESRLLSDFLNAHPDFQTGSEFTSVGYYQNPTGDNNKLYSGHKIAAWKVSPIKANSKILPQTKDLYPTAYELVKEFNGMCSICTYSILEPNTTIFRHTDIENRDAKTIRVHVPLYVPNGDIGFEVEGEEVSWSDIFSFNNQKLHSAWNNTSERRLVLLLDLERSACGLPPAPAWYPGINDGIPVFEKTRDHSLT